MNRDIKINPNIALVLKSISILVVLLVGYYLLILKPSVTVAEKNLETKNLLVKQHANLLQNRLAVVQLTKLNPTSARYIYSRSRVYDILTTTHKEGMTLISTPLPENVPEELKSEYPEMQQIYKEILENNLQFLNKQVDLDDKLGNVFEFFPKRELSGLEQEEIDAAIEGIDYISQSFPQYTNIVEETQNTLRNGNIEDISLKFRELKTEIFKVKQMEVESEIQLEILAEQTTLLNKYTWFIESL